MKEATENIDTMCNSAVKELLSGKPMFGVEVVFRQLIERIIWRTLRGGSFKIHLQPRWRARDKESWTYDGCLCKRCSARNIVAR